MECVNWDEKGRRGVGQREKSEVEQALLPLSHLPSLSFGVIYPFENQVSCFTGMSYWSVRVANGPGGRCPLQVVEV